MFTDRNAVAYHLTTDRWASIAVLERILTQAQQDELAAALVPDAATLKIEMLQRWRGQAKEIGVTSIEADAVRELELLGVRDPVVVVEEEPIVERIR